MRFDVWTYHLGSIPGHFKNQILSSECVCVYFILYIINSSLEMDVHWKRFLLRQKYGIFTATWSENLWKRFSCLLFTITQSVGPFKFSEHGVACVVMFSLVTPVEKLFKK